jgi:uncharacterized protein with HEPN domain
MKEARRDPRVYLQDILSAIVHVERYTTEGKRVFLEDEKTQDAVIRQLSVIGEAAARLPIALKTKHPEIPWKKVIGMRNIIIHEYADIRVESIWETVERDLPGLRDTVEAALRNLAA